MASSSVDASRRVNRCKTNRSVSSCPLGIGSGYRYECRFPSGNLSALSVNYHMWDSLRLVDHYPQPGEKPMAAVLAPLYEDGDGQVRVVLTKRPDTMPTHAGHISFPGGRPEPTDNGPIDTALRETHEEVGIEPARVEILGFLPPIDTVEFNLLVLPVVGRVETPLELVPSQREVAKVYTPLLSDLANPDSWWHVPWNDWKVWYYDLEGDTLWGATARMVRLLVGLED